MKILSDECLPLDLRHSFPSHAAQTAQWAGLKGKKNGELLLAAHKSDRRPIALRRCDLGRAEHDYVRPNCPHPLVGSAPAGEVSLAIMPEETFGALEQLLESENPSAGFDLLIGQFRAAKDYRSWFEARLMRKRLELGLPLFLADDLTALAPGIREAYSRAVTDAAREVGELCLSDGEIAQAWPYLRATGDSARVADAIENVEAGEDVNRIIEIAFQEEVHPAKGLELIVAKYGICQALSAFEVSAVKKDREKCIAVLARTLHTEAVERLGSAIEQKEGSRPVSTSIAELIGGRDWLFGEYSAYVDTSHLVSLLQYCPEVTDAGVLRIFHDLCEYGKRLSPLLRVQSQPPFEDVYIDFDHYALALLGIDVESHLAHFRKKVAESDPEQGSLPAQALVGLLARLARYEEALEVALANFPHARSIDLACPTATELCQLARRFDRLKELARERGDWLSYAAASLEARGVSSARR
jgi:hypothetical protein